MRSSVDTLGTTLPCPPEQTDRGIFPKLSGRYSPTTLGLPPIAMGRQTLSVSVSLKGDSVSISLQVIYHLTVSLKESLFYFSLDSICSMISLSLGDLMIHGLTKEDCMEYTVDLINTEKTSTVNKLRLQVKGKCVIL